MKKFAAFVMALMMAAFLAAPAMAYPDVDANTQAGKAISTVSDKGIMAGYEDGTFKPDSSITRAEFAKVAVLAAQSKLGDVPMTLQYVVFDDVKEDGWYVENIQKAVNMRLMKGDAEGTFRPNDTMTTSEVYTVMLRILGYKVDDKGTWPNNYLELAAKLGANIDKAAANKPVCRGTVAEIVSWTLNQPLPQIAEQDTVAATDTYGVVTGVVADKVTVGTVSGKMLTLKDSGSNGAAPEVGQLVQFTADKDNELLTLGREDVVTNNLYDAVIKNGKITLNGKAYEFAADAAVISINNGGGVATVDVEKLQSGTYAAGLRSSNYTVPIQYVLAGGKVQYLLISDYAGQSDQRFGFVESVGTGADGIMVKFWGDKTEYLWDDSKNSAAPQEDKLYAYVFRGDGVRGYEVAVADEQIKNAVVTEAKNDIKTAGGKPFIIADDTVIWKVEYDDDGTITSCEAGDTVEEGDMVRVRYTADKNSNDTGLEAAYIIIDETDK